MSDEALRNLERRYRQTGAVEDAEAWLRARVRAGGLPEERLHLAAWLGHAAAIRLTGARVDPRTGATTRDERHEGPVTPIDVRDWGRGLMRFGAEVALRAAVADLGRCLAAFERAAAADTLATPPTRERLAAVGRSAQRTFERVVAWIAGSAAARAEVAAEVALDLEAARLHHAQPGQPRTPPPRTVSVPTGLAVHDLAAVAAALAPPARIEAGLVDLGSLWRATHALRHRTPRSPARRSEDVAAAFTDLRRAVAAALLPWAFDDVDPVRDLGRDRLDRLDVASPCSARWEDMQGDDRVRRCAACDLQVHDLSALTRPEAEAVLDGAAGGRLCVRLYRRADGRVLTQDCPPGLAARLPALPVRDAREVLGVADVVTD